MKQQRALDASGSFDPGCGEPARAGEPGTEALPDGSVRFRVFYRAVGTEDQDRDSFGKDDPFPEGRGPNIIREG